jgi:2-keto-4-pentenoate hydratase/2-oxohepta-3-ene-1,7-dioic acid hydratase in catechol pathway
VKLVSYIRSGRGSYGAVVGAGIVDLGSRLGERYPSLRELIARGGLREAEQAARRESPDVPVDDTEFLPPIPAPEKILCVGVNYLDRNEEYKDDSERPRYPSIFMRTPGSVVGHGQPIVRPAESAQLDYEGEIAIVIGAPGRRIPAASASTHIAGLTCMNEGTIRDWLRHGKFNVTQGKNFDRTGSIGPWLVTADEFSGYDHLTVTTRVNGELRQHDSTSRLLFSFPYLITYISTWTTLRPGDVIATGTPTGAGARFDPPRYLRPGDRVEVEVSGVGTLANPVVDEDAGRGGGPDG